MVKTFSKKKPYSKTRKNVVNRNRSLYVEFQKQITIQFFEMLLLIKLYHWKTHSYATHKATDELYGKFNEHMDHFMEVLLGKSQIRMNLMDQKNISLIDLTSKEKLIDKIDNFKSYLVSLTDNKLMSLKMNSDLLNIRDEILGDMNQFLYLLLNNR